MKSPICQMCGNHAYFHNKHTLYIPEQFMGETDSLIIPNDIQYKQFEAITLCQTCYEKYKNGEIKISGCIDEEKYLQILKM